MVASPYEGFEFSFGGNGRPSLSMVSSGYAQSITLWLPLVTLQNFHCDGTDQFVFYMNKN